MEKPKIAVQFNLILKNLIRRFRIFEDRTATILWCCIKNGHVTSQYFNKNVLDVAEEFNKKSYRKNYEEFLEIAHVLLSFGQVMQLK